MAEDPDPGDLIEIIRGLFRHWAVYVGRGFIVHLVPNDDQGSSGTMSMFATSKALVKKEKLRQVAGTDKWQVNNILDHKYKPRPVDDIVEGAGDLVGREMKYSVRKNNCEHFATELRYGKAESRQVQIVEQVAVTALMASPAGLMGVGLVALAGAGATSSRSSDKSKK